MGQMFNGPDDRPDPDLDPLVPLSRRHLDLRRSHLRRRRHWKIARRSWRLVAVGLVAIATASLVTSAPWVIRGPEQVDVLGNRMLSDDHVRSLLGISYPQSLWKLQPQVIAASLRARGPVAHAEVTRQLLPPKLVVQVTELFPVAVIESTVPVQRAGGNPRAQIGLMDSQGTWIELERYQAMRPVPQLPVLKAIGDYGTIQREWAFIYRWLSLSPVAVQVVDWRNPRSIRLQTELGPVELGTYGRDRWAQQMALLARMRSLPQQLDPRQIDHIDFRDLERPAIQMRSTTLDKGAQQQLKPP